MKSLAEVSSDNNRALLRVIADTEPESISALPKTTGRKLGDLSRTLWAMSNYGIVDLKRERNLVRPVAVDGCEKKGIFGFLMLQNAD